MDYYKPLFEDLSPAAESITLDAFHRLGRLRKITDLPMARRRAMNTIELPVNSVFHYQGEGIDDDGPSNNHPCFNKQSKNIAVKHILTYNTDAQVAIKNVVNLNTHISDYHRQNKRTRRLPEDSKLPDDANTLVTYNYGLLDLRVRQMKQIGYWYTTWRALMDTIVYHIVELANNSPRQQFICIDLPQQMLTTAQLNNRKLFVPNGDTFSKAPNDRRNITIHELWGWLQEPDTTVFAPLTKLAETGNLGKLEFIFTYKEFYLVVNANLLFGSRKPTKDDIEAHPSWAPWSKEVGRVEVPTLTRDFFLFLAVIHGMDNPEETVDEDEEQADDETEGKIVVSNAKKLETRVEIVNKIAEMTQKTVNEEVGSKTTLQALRDEPEENFIEEIKESAALAGTITAAELRRVDKLIEKSNAIKAPNGQPIQEFIKITPEETVLKPEEFPDHTLVFDKNMTKSTSNAFIRDYVEKLMLKDMLGSIMSFQKSGVIVTALDVQENKTMTETSYSISMQIGEIGGSTTTINFKIQAVQPDGTFIANGTKYQFRHQLGELPIRKIDSNEVVLTSYYGKVSVKRNTKRVNDFSVWLGNAVVAAGLNDANTRVSELKATNAFDNKLKAPRVYSIISKRVASIMVDGIYYSFDHRVFYKRDDVKKVAEKLAVESPGSVLCGVNADGFVYIDKDNMFNFRANRGGVTPIGDVYKLFGLSREKAPLEYAQVDVYSKAVPVGLVLGYKLGITKLLNSLGVTYRVDYTGKKPALEDSEYAIRFNDCSIVFDRDDTEVGLIMNGFNEFEDAIQRYPMAQFDDKSVYYNVLESKYISAKHLDQINDEWLRFIDPITKRELERMKEPTTYRGLLLRSVELLSNEEYPDETSVEYSRIKGNERVAGHIYTMLSRAIRKQTRKNGKKTIDLSPYSIFQYAATDSSIMLVSEINPLEHLRGNNMLTFSGHQGRNERTMTGETRAFHKSARGIMSEGGVDSGMVGINVIMPANPNITSLYGGIGKTDPVKDKNIPGLFSVNALASPGGLHEDSKRLTFKGIQDAHTRPCKNYKPYAWRTGMDSVIADQCTSEKFAITAKEEGVVVEKTPHFVTVKYASGKTESYKYGKLFGVSAGTIVPMPTVCDVEKGEKFKVGTPIVYNTDFFSRDPCSPEGRLVFQFGIPVTVQFHDNSDTIEDSTAISKRLAKELSIDVTHQRVITAKFTDEVYDLVKLGQLVHQEDSLCKILDKAAAAVIENEDTVGDTLEYLDRTTPRAKYGGTVESIEIYYHGELEDMTESLRKYVKQSDASIAQRHPEGKAFSGSCGDNFRVEGKQLAANTVAICIKITDAEPMGSSDKGVLGTQLKCTVTRVMTETLKAEDGTIIDLNFGQKSVENRLVYGAYLQLTMNSVLQCITKNFINKVL